MESKSALEVTQRTLQQSQQQAPRGSTEGKDLASEFSKLFQSVFGGSQVQLASVSDPLAVYSDIEVAAPVEEKPVESTKQAAPKEEVKAKADSELKKDDSTDLEKEKQNALLEQPLEQKVQMQVATVVKQDSPREAIKPEVPADDMLAKAKVTQSNPQLVAAETELQDPVVQQAATNVKKEMTSPVGPTAPQAQAAQAAPEAAKTEAAAPKVEEKVKQPQVQAPVSSLTGETTTSSETSATAQTATNPGQPPVVDSSSVQMKAAMAAALGSDVSHKLQAATSGQADLSKGLMGVKVDAAQKVANLESRTQRNAVVRAGQQELIEKVQKAIADAARSKDGNSLIFRMEQPELGSLTVKLTRRNDELHARIIPDNREVEATVRERIGELHTALQNSGIKVSQIHLSVGPEYSETEMFQFGYAFMGQDSSQQDASSRSASQEGADKSALAGRNGVTTDDVAVAENLNSSRMKGQVDRGMWVA